MNEETQEPKAAPKPVAKKAKSGAGRQKMTATEAKRLGLDPKPYGKSK